MDSSKTELTPLTHERVRDHTAASVNQRIDAAADASVDIAQRGGRDSMIRRLAELDREWDIDRALMLNFAVVGGSAFIAGLNRFSEARWLRPRKKGFLYFFGVQLAFLGVHAIAGWCPPVVVLRRLGFRTQKEIQAERAELVNALATKARA